MSPTFPLSRHGRSLLLPLLLVVAAHVLLLVMLARDAVPRSPVERVLPVALLLAAPAQPSAAPAAAVAPAPEAEPLPVPKPAALPAVSPALVAQPSPPADLQPAVDSPAVAVATPAATPAAASASASASALPAGNAATVAPAVVPAVTGSAAAPGLLPPRLMAGAPRPLYPDAARRQRAEGRVTLQLNVRADGRIAAVAVLESSGHPVLDRAARDVAWRWRLLPAQRDGRAVEGVLVKTLEFRLEN